MASPLAQEQVHHPTAPYMLTRLAAVVQDVGVVAARFFKGVGKDGETGGVKRPGWQDAVLVGGMGKSNDGGRLPCRLQGGGVEGVAEDITLASKMLTDPVRQRTGHRDAGSNS